MGEVFIFVFILLGGLMFISLFSWVFGRFMHKRAISEDDTFEYNEAIDDESEEETFALANIIPEEYDLPQSPFKVQLDDAIHFICDDAIENLNEKNKRSVEDALYFAVKKRMKKRQYEGNEHEYLLGLISDISEAQNEFEQVCYASTQANDTFSRLKNTVLNLIK